MSEVDKYGHYREEIKEAFENTCTVQLYRKKLAETSLKPLYPAYRNELDQLFSIFTAGYLAALDKHSAR